MATVYQFLGTHEAQFPTSNPAAIVETQGTNFPVNGLAFDTSTQESAFFKFLAQNYGSGDITVTVLWYADTASANGVAFGVSLAALTPNTDSQDIETKAFDTEVIGTDTHLGTTGQRLHSFDITLNETDNLANGDLCFLRVRRVPANAGDTMAGDAIVVGIRLAYSDT